MMERESEPASEGRRWVRGDRGEGGRDAGRRNAGRQTRVKGGTTKGGKEF